MTAAALHVHHFDPGSTAPADARPLVCLHGFLGTGADWADFAARTGRRVLAPDLPGHGRSMGLPDEAYTFEGAADAALAALDRSGVGRSVLVGYSMGGRLALHLALAAPGRFVALVLESASPGLPSEPERAARRRLDAERAAALEADLPEFLRAWYALPLFATLPAAQRGRLVAERATGDPRELARALVGMGTGAQPSLWPRLPDLDVPTLAVAGSRDAKFAALARRMAEVSSAVRAAVVDGAGHNVHIEAPEAFARAVKGFAG